MNQISSFSYYPKRVVCLTEETTETLYAIGAHDIIVGVSGFCVRPKNVRKEKKTISTYLDAKFDEIIELKPDVVFAWSDLQADICSELIRRGINVICFNHRSIEGIKQMIFQLGLIVGKEKETQAFLSTIEISISKAREFSLTLSHKPKVYFEEWYDPLISGICWVSEIIELCGGVDVYSVNRQYPDAKRRIIKEADEIVEKNPDIILVSWCGKMYKPEKILSRSSWDTMSAVRNNQIHEIHSSIILQPGPAALTDGIDEVKRIYTHWNNSLLQ